MPRGRPVDAQKRALVLQLHGEGKGRNVIAAEAGVSTATVSGIVHAEGLDFVRRDAVVALAARKVDLAAMRADLAQRLMLKAAELLDSMTGEYEVHSFGAGQGESYRLHTGMVSRPPAGDQAKLMTALGIAVQRSLELDRADQDGGQAAAVSVVDGLMQAFRGAVALLPDPVAVTEP